jgi:hypothetical protein
MKKVFIATGVAAGVGGLLTAVLVSSCDTECTMEARPSAIIEFIDINSSTNEVSTVSPTEIWYTVTDATGASQTGRPQCMNDGCSEWMLGYEKPGTYEIHATVCGQEYVNTLEVGMTEDGCHVATEWARFEVDSSLCPPVDKVATEVRAPEPCSLEGRYSVIVQVGKGEGEVLTPVPTTSRYFKWSGDADQRKWPGLCLDQDCTQFAAGIEQAGRFEVGAEVCGEVVAQTVAVEKTADGCHVDTQLVNLVVKGDGCEDEPKAVYPPVDPTCSGWALPSAIVMPVIDGGDVWMPYPTEQMWYENNGQTHRATCAGELDQNGKCSRWVTGWERDGKFAAYTETCDEITKVEYKVGKTMDGCHVETIYVPVFMDTRGCIQAPQPKGNEPRPMLTYDAPPAPPAVP